MANDPSFKEMRAQRIAMGRYIKLVKAMSKGQRVDARDYAATYESIFSTPPPTASASELDQSTTVIRAALKLLYGHGQEVEGGGRLIRKFTAADRSILLTCSIVNVSPIPREATSNDLEFRVVGVVNGAVAFTFQFDPDGRPDGATGIFNWHDEGSGIAQFLDYCRSCNHE